MPRPNGSAPIIPFTPLTHAKEFRDDIAAATTLDTQVTVLSDHLGHVIENQEAQEKQAVVDKGEIMEVLKGLGTKLEGVGTQLEGVATEISNMKRSEDEQRAALLVELGHQAQTNDAQNQAIVKVAQKVTTLQQVKVVAKWIVGAGGILTGGDLVHRLIDFILAAAKH